MTVRININDLCEKCLIAAWDRPADELAFLGYFMFAAQQELILAGLQNPRLVEDVMPVALQAAAEFVLSLRTDIARALTDVRFEEECNIADVSSEEFIRAAMDRVLEHNDTNPYINVPKQLIN